MQEPPYLFTTADLAMAFGIESRTISQYRWMSRAGGRYEGHPFPSPDGYVGRSPVWNRSRRQELQAWFDGRPGQGAGGGRKS